MSQMPEIKRAIPKKRFQYGPFGAVVLGEVESGDAHDYRFVLAMVSEGNSNPSLYVTAERNTEGDGGSHRLRIHAAGKSRDMGASDRWARLEAFTEEALRLAGQALALEDERPIALM